MLYEPVIDSLAFAARLVCYPKLWTMLGLPWEEVLQISHSLSSS